jgi:hypothetical protein
VKQKTGALWIGRHVLTSGRRLCKEQQAKPSSSWSYVFLLQLLICAFCAGCVVSRQQLDNQSA